MIIVTKTYLIKDIDCEMIVEITSRKELLSYLNEYLDNLRYDWFDASDDSFCILYKDGSYDTINEDYDGHRIRKTNIASIVYTNSGTDMVFGNYEVNEYGVVTPAFETIIDNNIEEIN